MTRKKIINIIILFLWMGVIFIMSSFNADDSGSQSGLIVNVLSRFVSIKNISMASFIIRKLAHFTEYFILGVLALNCLKDYIAKKDILISIIFCFLYASSDEFHQTFVPGRAGLFTDVLIDSCGAIAGVFFFKFYGLKKVQHEK